MKRTPHPRPPTTILARWITIFFRIGASRGAWQDEKDGPPETITSNGRPARNRGRLSLYTVQPDRNYHDGTDQDVRYRPTENLATDFDQPFNGILPAFQDISRIDIEGRQYGTDQQAGYLRFTVIRAVILGIVLNTTAKLRAKFLHKVRRGVQ